MEKGKHVVRRNLKIPVFLDAGTAFGGDERSLLIIKWLFIFETPGRGAFVVKIAVEGRQKVVFQPLFIIFAYITTKRIS
jgi:hypothetical protein